MRARELYRAYPNVQQAVAYTELIICGAGDDPESSWDLMMSVVPPLSPAVVVDLIREAVRETIDEGKCNVVSEDIYRQTSHPEFLTCVAGKMGMM